MKIFKLIFLLLLVFSTASFAGNSPWTKVWVAVPHSENFEFTGIVLIELEENSINCTTETCPDEDITLVGDGYDRRGNWMGLHVIKVKKGYLNDDRNWSFDKPKIKPKEANNLWIWEV